MSANQQAKRWMVRWETRSDIENVFSPQKWGFILSKPDKAYTTDCPTLKQYDEVYEHGAAQEWVKLQLVMLYGMSTCKDKAIADSINLFSQTFANSVRAFKISELLLFFARYKAGRYDNSFLSFDPKRIGNAFFFEFIKERNFEIDCIVRKEAQEQIERRRFTPPEGYTSWSWYQELRKRASNGDKEAIELLNTRL